MIRQNNEISRQKALGQYFTGFHLARLLAFLASSFRPPESVLDPMCGSGDMLFAAQNIFSISTQLTGVDIDASVISRSKDLLPGDTNIRLHEGNAFDSRTWEKIGRKQYDLVITNPPYVRYQSQNDTATKYGLPNAINVRNGLLSIAESLPFNHTQERDFFIKMIKGYSGLADLAVPSWLLCAILTKPGGSLAMVVPEAWLSRDYATPIHLMLMKFFRLLFVVEDANHSWFKDAQIKTTLMVAQRNIGETQFPVTHNFYLFSSLDQTKSNESIVKQLYPNKIDPDYEFSRDMKIILEKGHSIPEVIPFKYELRDLNRETANSIQRAQKVKRLSRLLASEIEVPTEQRPIYLPQILHNLIGDYSSKLIYLENLGVGIGQGLRTGANNFFYLNQDNVEVRDGVITLVTSKEMGKMTIQIPENLTLPVLRYQSELPQSKRAIDKDSLIGRVISLYGYGLPEDIEKINNPNREKLIPLPEALIKYVCRAAMIPARKDGDKLIPDMSAVKTNQSASRGSFWYCLPQMTDRHHPDLIIPRVNNLVPGAWLNPERQVVIDANFSSIWLLPGARNEIDVWALLTLLNSIWAQAIMELSGSVMGGGALKLEASHLRRLPLPILKREDIEKLSQVGKKIALGDLEDMQESNRIIISNLVPKKFQDSLLSELSAITSTHFLNRHKT